MSLLRLRSRIGNALYGPWRRRVIDGSAVIHHQELRALALELRPPGRLQLHTDHYRLHGMAPPPLLAALDGVHPDPGAFLAMLPDAELVGRHATAVWRGRVVLESVLGSPGYLLQHGDPRALVLRRWLPVRQRWPSALVLANPLNGNYFHWVCEALPLLEALEQVQALGVEGPEPLVVVNGPLPPFVLPWLELFGIGPERVRVWSPQRLRVGRLLMPSLRYGRLCLEHPHWGRHLYPRWALEFVRGRALAGLGPSFQLRAAGPQKVFLSRPRSGARGLANHDAVAACLLRLGYREVLAEQLTIREQIALFASLTHLVAIHGAGMVNLIFSREVRVLELFPANRDFGFTYQFLQISAQLGHSHHLLACSADVDQNMQVPLQVLEELVSDIDHL
jgi:hypothetical protein